MGMGKKVYINRVGDRRVGRLREKMNDLFKKVRFRNGKYYRVTIITEKFMIDRSF